MFLTVLVDRIYIFMFLTVLVDRIYIFMFLTVLVDRIYIFRFWTVLVDRIYIFMFCLPGMGDTTRYCSWSVSWYYSNCNNWIYYI